MPVYEPRQRYSGTVNGRRVDLAPGVPTADLDPADVVAILRDAPSVLDIAAPLAPEAIDEIHERLREAERDRLAAASPHAAAARLAAAVKTHRVRFGPWCPGTGSGSPTPFGLVENDVPHLADVLDAAELPDGHVVACPAHLRSLVALGRIATPPELPDRTVGRYKVEHRYSATYEGYRAHGAFFMPVAADERPRVLRLTAGDVVELPAALADWINRDSPGCLTPEEET